MMDRMALYRAWEYYYSEFTPSGQKWLIEEAVETLEGRMRELGRFPQRTYKGFIKRRLETAFGMSLGVHKQLLGRLTFALGRGTLKGGRAGFDQ